MDPKVRRIYLPKFKFWLTIVLSVLAVLVVVKGVLWAKHWIDVTGLTPGTIVRLLFDNGGYLKTTDGRTNVLVLGISGGKHAGSDLTDTMMVISINPSTRAMALISIPRDLWSDALKDKVNSAYHYGEIKQKGGGIILARAIVEDVVGLPLHYGFLMDFSGFKKIIDLADGVTVVVPRAFTDTEFPLEGRETDECEGDPELRCRYESVHFDEGEQRMDGERALKYVRSRHADNGEGSDFARSRRQQDVLLALKQKLLIGNVWLSPNRMKLLLAAFDDATETDMNLGELATLGKFLTRVGQDNIIKISIEEELTTPAQWLYGGRYVLVPTESLESIHSYIKSKL